MPVLCRILNSVVAVVLLCGTTAAGWGQTGNLPPVKLFPSEGAAQQPATAAQRGADSQPQGAQVPASAGGTYAQPSPGMYAQPKPTAPAASRAASAPAAAAGTYAQPGRGTFTQPGQGMPVATASPATAPSEATGRHVSLGFGAPSTSAAVPLPPVAAAASPVPAVAAESASRSSVAPVARASGSLPPPRLFGTGVPEAAESTFKPGSIKMVSASIRAKPVLKAKTAPRKEPPVIVEPGKPLLDEYGMQRLDPDGKPMFGPPATQARDKHGKPLFENSKPVFQTAENMGFDEHGRHIKAPRTEAGAKAAQVNIEHGAFTVDGLVGKVRLNYNIGEMRYFYLYIPDTGVTVVSPNPFPGAAVQRGAFRGNMLTVKIEEHTLAVSSSNAFFGKKPVDAYVRVDRGFLLPGAKFPVFGYGDTLREPYVWPGSRLEEKVAGVSDDAPPVPKNLRPKLLEEAPPVTAPAAVPAKAQAIGTPEAVPVADSAVPSGHSPATSASAAPSMVPVESPGVEATPKALPETR